MPGRIQLDPFLNIVVGGVMTVVCKCGWEAVFVMPEEQIVLMHTLFQHLIDAHHMEFPPIVCLWH